MNIDSLKSNPAGAARLTYKLRNANVYVSAEGFHFTDYLDPVEEISTEMEGTQLTDRESAYIETQLQANLHKFQNQADILAALSRCKTPGSWISAVAAGCFYRS